nr:hypothetical protein [Actinomycetota bacterium]
GTMRGRRAALLAWSLWALSAALLALGVVFSVLTRSTPDPNAFGVTFDALLSLALLSFPTVGALVVSRHRGNTIGWLFCVVGVSFGLTSGAYGWAVYALFARPGVLPGAEVAAWFATWAFLPALFCIPVYLFLLFPDGRPASRRWRPVAWFAGVGLLATTLGNALSPGRLAQPPFESVENPAGIEAIGGWIDVVVGFGFWLTLASILLAGASLVYRFRRARGPERQQLKWFAGSAVLFAATSVAYTVLPGVPEQAGQIATLFAFAGIAVSVGVAILKHRLYDIDLVINRTLVYAILTAALALVYVGGVASLQLVLRPLTGGESQLAVVASTLAIAALFVPLRRRIQAFIDRLFYRRKYDAKRVLEGFSARLRDETDLEALGGELVGVARETMQPEHASLWLRPPAGRHGGTGKARG